MALLTIKRQKEIDQKIESIRAQTGMLCPDKSIIQIIRSYDNELEIYLHDFGKYSNIIRGAIAFKEKAIYINQDMSERNQTFSIAHEFGHYVIDGHQNKDVQYRIDYHSDLFPNDPIANLQELEANYFAGEMLIPEKTIRKKLNNNLKNTSAEQVRDLIAYFKVSELALKTRIAWILKNPK